MGKTFCIAILANAMAHITAIPAGHTKEPYYSFDPHPSMCLVQSDHLNQPTSSMPSPSYEPIQKAYEGHAYYSDGSRFGEPFNEQLCSSSTEAIDHFAQEFLSYADLLADMTLLDDVQPSLQMPQEHPSQSVDQLESGLYQEANVVSTSQRNDLSHEGTLTSNIHDIEPDTAALRILTEGRRNTWFIKLDPKTKQKLVTKLQSLWGYSMDVAGFKCAMNHARTHIYKEVGLLFLNSKTDVNLLKEIVEATRPHTLNEVKKRKKCLINELIFDHKFAPNTAKKYVKEAFQLLSVEDATDAALIDIFVRRRTESLSTEMRSIRRRGKPGRKKAAVLE